MDMIKDYLKKQNISVYALSKESGIAYSTLNDLVNGKVPIDRCRVSLLRSLSSSLNLSMDEFYEICCSDSKCVSSSYNVEAGIRVRAKYYYAMFDYKEVPVELKLCKVNEDNTFYIEDIARWRVESYIRRRRMQEFK